MLPFIAPEAAYGMAMYSVRAVLHGQTGHVFEMIRENFPDIGRTTCSAAMPDQRLATRPLSRGAGARDGATRGLLSGALVFLEHPAATFGEHLTAPEERIRALEARLAGDLRTLVDTGIIAVEETVAGVEHRREEI